MFFLGLDIGTQAARAIVCDEKGNLAASSCAEIAASKEKLPDGWSEQDAGSWWEAASASLRTVVDRLREKDIASDSVEMICVTSTSGTILPLDRRNQPLRNAIMYNDTRALEEASLLNGMGGTLCKKLGYRFNPSFALAKMFWIKRHEAKVFAKTHRFVHATDFIVGKLSGDYSVTDTSNALKSGYDLIDLHWPRFIASDLQISSSLLPKVVSPGTVIGSVTSAASSQTGLGEGTPICAGVTDGVASFISSGATSPGQWTSVLGTTLVVKGITKQLIKDREGRIYSHRHPDGFWLPGGASSVGGECLKEKFPGEDLKEKDSKVLSRVPTGLIIYPLVRKGERFPFVNPEAEGFIVGKAEDKYELYGGYLEGVAMVEKWIYEMLEELGAAVENGIYVAGGGARSHEWLQIRADILGRRLLRPKMVEAAFGVAILAASNKYGSLREATESMVKMELEVEPRPRVADEYRAKYTKFRRACRAIGYG